VEEIETLKAKVAELANQGLLANRTLSEDVENFKNEVRRLVVETTNHCENIRPTLETSGSLKGPGAAGQDQVVITFLL